MFLCVKYYNGFHVSCAQYRNRLRFLRVQCGQVGARHLDANIDSVVTALTSLFAAAVGRTPRFRAAGGEARENLALQNIQARAIRCIV